MEIKITRFNGTFGKNSNYWGYDNPEDKDYYKKGIKLNGFDLNRFYDDVESIWIDTNDYNISINGKNQLILDLKPNKKFTFLIYN